MNSSKADIKRSPVFDRTIEKHNNVAIFRKQDSRYFKEIATSKGNGKIISASVLLAMTILNSNTVQS